MNLLFLTDNPNTLDLVQWLREDTGETVTALGGPPHWDAEFTSAFDLVICHNYHHLLPRRVLGETRVPILNLHPSLLPWNRGTHANLWSWLEDTPKGVTIHRIDSGVDSGPILLQQRLEMEARGETLTTSYEKLQEALKTLFKSRWSELSRGTLPERSQPSGGSTHRWKDLDRVIERIPDFHWSMTIEDVVERYHSR